MREKNETNTFSVRDNLGAQPKVRIFEDSYHLVTIDQERKHAAREAADSFRQELTSSELAELDSYKNSQRNR